MTRQEHQQTVSIQQVELIFFLSAVVLFLLAGLEVLLRDRSLLSSHYVQLPTVIIALGYWTLSFRGLRLLIAGLSPSGGAGRSKLLAGVALKLSALLLLGDFMLTITRDKAICFFITMIGYFFLGIAGMLCMHAYLSLHQGNDSASQTAGD